MRRKLLSIMTALVVLSGCAEAKPVSNSNGNAVAATDHNQNKDSKNSEEKDNVNELAPYKKTTKLNNEAVTSITVRASESGPSIDVPKERYYTILDGLYGLDAAIAKANEQEKPDKAAVIRIETKTDTYEIPYDLATNRLQIEGEWVYAYDYTLLIMHSLLAPESEIGKVDHLLEKARIEFEQNSTVTDTHVIDIEQAKVEGKDYIAWDKELKDEQGTSKIMFYDRGSTTVKALTFFKSGIIAFNGQLIFTDPKYRTKDGVHVGMTSEEVLKKIGEPNVKLASHWGYKLGDYLKFHLYFDEGKVKWICLTMPL